MIEVIGSRTYRVRHRTSYEYGATMSDGYSVACLVPRDTFRQRVVSSDVEVDPVPSEVDVTTDLFGNRVHQFGLHEPHHEMVVEATSQVSIDLLADPVDDTPWERVAELGASATGAQALEVGMFRSSSMLVDVDVLRRSLGSLTSRVFEPGRPIVDTARALGREIHDTFEFDSSATTVSTPLVDVLEARRGVCQDFAHLAVGCLRSFGLAARYVSGYIETIPPPGEERLVGADASHAWVSVWTPHAGWVDFDPTNAHLPANDHVTVAWGRDYADVIPVRGVMIGPIANQDLDVAVDVERI